MEVGVIGDRTPVNSAMRGWLRQISPDENLHALILNIYEVIQAGATNDVLRAWAGIMLSVPTKYVHLNNEKEGFWRANCIREKLGDDYEALTLSPAQRAVQLYNFKMKHKVASNRGFKAV